MSGFSRPWTCSCLCMSVWSEARGRKWEHLVFHEWLPWGIVFYLELFNVLCKCMSNVCFRTKAPDHPPANTHAAAGKRPCSAGWQEVRTGKDSYSLPPGPVRTQKVQNVKAKRGIKCCNFMCFNLMRVVHGPFSAEWKLMLYYLMKIWVPQCHESSLPCNPHPFQSMLSSYYCKGSHPQMSLLAD